ncbi:hypothetical protein [Ornithinimicrobium sp. Y1694]|uniref:hypothetical protein n=1 Tax=Ornithinimicrobium sp. Y1694 TaxID=3418590 RepID=UPI003CEA48CC
MKAYIYLKSMATRREAGQGSLEYIGVVIVAVLLVMGIVAAASGWGGEITDAMGRGVSKILSGANF